MAFSPAQAIAEPVPWIRPHEQPFAQGEPPRGGGGGHRASPQLPPPILLGVLHPAVSSCNLLSCQMCVAGGTKRSREPNGGLAAAAGRRFCRQPPKLGKRRLNIWFRSQLSPARPSRHGGVMNHFAGSTWGFVFFFIFSFFFSQLIYLGGGQRADEGRRLKNSNSGGFAEQKRQENIIWGATCCQFFLLVLPLPEGEIFPTGGVPALSSPG